MSATAHWAGLTTAPPRVDAPGGRGRELAGGRPAVRAVTFTALALFGIGRWATLTAPAPTVRLLGLVAVSAGAATLGPMLSRRHRALGTVAGAAAVIALFPLSGVPLAWVAHLRIAVIADAIGQGLTGLPRIFLPYSGLNQPVRMVITMGAAVLLLDAGLLLGLAPARLGDLRRGAAALPLIALAVIPSTLMRPSAAYLQGVLLFGLVAAFLWGERVRRGEVAATAGVCAVAAVAALVTAPKLAHHRPWIDPQSIAGGLTPAHLEQFDWSQRYGPLNWPRTGRAVLEVQAPRSEYWKAEDLDAFNGRQWVVAGAEGAPDPLLGVSPASLHRWTETLRVTFGSMSGSAVIAAGTSIRTPVRAGTNILPGASPGTWMSASALGPGDSYEVTTYTPHPTADDLNAAGTDYPRELEPYRTMQVPTSWAPAAGLPVAFAPFHAGNAAVASTIAASPYGPAFELAVRLADAAGTPYGFVRSVESYLSRGFSYDETPPQRSFPLASFLFGDRLGYCQQFAGAMALLLRMGGVPARVAAGFAPGQYDDRTHRWVVSDVDAHAWVEAWFPRYGWVRFDPTPPAAPARGGRSPIAATSTGGQLGRAAPPVPFRRAVNQPAAGPSTSRRATGGHSSSGALIGGAIGVALLAVVAALAVAFRGRRPESVETLVAELERALARAGRPLPRGTTLAALEERFRASPEASAYVRAIRTARFGAGDALPTKHQRRAVRAQLRAGLGLGGAARSLWALPPGWPRHKTVSWRRVRGIHS